VDIMETRPGTYAVARFRGGAEIFARAYDFIYGEWLPGSGYRPDDAPAFEMYAGGCEAGRFVFDLCLPVKPL
jgi:AraC family transcriptional regulator